MPPSKSQSLAEKPGVLDGLERSVPVRSVRAHRPREVRTNPVNCEQKPMKAVQAQGPTSEMEDLTSNPPEVCCPQKYSSEQLIFTTGDSAAFFPRYPSGYGRYDMVHYGAALRWGHFKIMRISS